MNLKVIMPLVGKKSSMMKGFKINKGTNLGSIPPDNYKLLQVLDETETRESI